MCKKIKHAYFWVLSLLLTCTVCTQLMSPKTPGTHNVLLPDDKCLYAMERHKHLVLASYRAGTLIWSNGVSDGTQTTIERHQYQYISGWS
jgi:hypothetical protein